MLVLEIYPAWTKSAVYNIWSLTNHEKYQKVRIISHHHYYRCHPPEELKRSTRDSREIRASSCRKTKYRGCIVSVCTSTWVPASCKSRNITRQGDRNGRRGTEVSGRGVPRRWKWGLGRAESCPGPFYAYRMHIEPFRCIACMNNWFIAEINHPPFR